MKTKALTPREKILMGGIEEMEEIQKNIECRSYVEVLDDVHRVCKELLKQADEIKGPSELEKSFMKNTELEEYPNKTFEECKSSLELMTIKFYWMRDKLWYIWGMDENKKRPRTCGD